MKASVIHAYGGPEVMKYEDFPDPVPAKGEVLVRVAAASINPVDLIQRAGGTAAFFPVEFPGVIGWDVSGTIEALGPDVTEFRVGDRVLAWAFHTFAELCAVSTAVLARVPDGLDLQEAAALPLAGITGSQLISVASGLQSGQSVLVSGANGPVGRSAVFAAKERGAYVVAGVTSQQLEAAKDVGADEVVPLDVIEAFNALPEFDIIANCVRGDMAARLMAKAKAGGVFATVTGAPPNAGNYPAVRIADFVSKQDPATLDYVVEGVRLGKLHIPIDRKVPLSEAAAAMTTVAGGGIGKVLLVP